MPDAESLVTVATFGTLPQAELARGHLDAEGIRSFVLDSESVNMDWFLSGAVGGVKLQVAKSDFLAAEECCEQPRGQDRQGPGRLWPGQDHGYHQRSRPHSPGAVPAPDSIAAFGYHRRPGAVRDDASDYDDERDENEAESLVRTAQRPLCWASSCFRPP